MRKSLKKLITLSLSSSLVLANIPAAFAQESGQENPTADEQHVTPEEGTGTGGENGTDSGGSTEVPGEDENGKTGDEGKKEDTGDKKEEKGDSKDGGETSKEEPSSQDENKDKPESGSQSTQTPQRYTPPIYQTPSRTTVAPAPTVRPTPATPQVEEVEDELAVDLNSILSSSLTNPAYQEAYDQAKQVAESFDVKDLGDKSTTGSSQAEVTASIEKEVSNQVTKGQVTTVLYDYEDEASQQKAQLALYFKDDQLTAIQVNDPAVLEAQSTVQESDLEALVDPTQSYDHLVAGGLPIASYTYTIDNGLDTHYFGFLALVEGEANYTVAYGDENFMAVVYTEKFQAQEDELVTTTNKLVLGQEDSADETDQAQDDQSSEPTEGDDSQESDELTEEAPESSETEESSDEPAGEDGQTSTPSQTGSGDFLADFKPAGDYSDDSLIEASDLEKAVGEFFDKFENKETVSQDDIKATLGEPTLSGEVADNNFIDYYSVQDDQILILNFVFDQEGNLVTAKYENRTPDLYDSFPITIDQLIEIAGQAPSLSDIEAKVSTPVIQEYTAETGEVRYVWTRLGDKELKNIEAYRKVGSQDLELYYYEAE